MANVTIETELTFKVTLTATVDPAEPDVGIGSPIIQDIGIDRIEGLSMAVHYKHPVDIMPEGKVHILWASTKAYAEVESQVSDLIIEAYNESESA